MSRKICVVTGSRADYGLLYWIIKDIQADEALELQLVVTGMHLSERYGNTVQEIEKDGFDITCRVDTLPESGTASDVARSISLGVIGFSEAFERLSPDIVVLLGDRFEIFAAAQACLVHKIPIAHIAGGDTTEGAIDEAMRHSITKMAHLHFVTNPESEQRVLQLGEQPDRIFNVGSPGLDHLNRRPMLDREAIEERLGARLRQRNLLVTFHPVTLESDDGLSEFEELLAAFGRLDKDVALWFTKPNADAGGKRLASLLDSWVATYDGPARVYDSLGSVLYMSLMAQVDAVVGNSSSGLYEAPSLGVATVNIGNRQAGRLAAESVLHCPADRTSIADTIALAMERDCSGTVNPYGDGRASEKIVAHLRELPISADFLRKHFHMIGHPHV